MAPVNTVVLLSSKTGAAERHVSMCARRLQLTYARPKRAATASAAQRQPGGSGTDGDCSPQEALLAAVREGCTVG